jgi:hypothetical protein
MGKKGSDRFFQLSQQKIHVLEQQKQQGRGVPRAANCAMPERVDVRHRVG